MLKSLEPPSSPFEQPSTLHRIASSPLRYLAQNIFALQLSLRGSSNALLPEDQPIRVLCISDTHCQKPAFLPAADLLIHAGDLTNDGTADDIQEQVDWLAALDYPHKIVIAGNHDSFFDPRSRREKDKDREIYWHGPQSNLHYLQHSSVTLKFSDRGGREVRIYGAPQIPACGGPEFAFQYPRGQDAWSDTIPIDTDILVTHTPPRHHIDLPRGMGCEWLLNEVWRVRPRLHVFGHVHWGGREMIFWDQAQRTYEKLCDRKEGKILDDLLALPAWISTVRLIIFGAVGIAWSRVWGGQHESTFVNCALMKGSTGRLAHLPQVVVI